jgi:toxin CptA
MHNAPAVSYPVGRSRFQGCCLGLTGLIGLSVCTYWAVADDNAGWRQGLALLMLAVVSLNAYRHWLKTPAGMLRWDGLHWHLEFAQPDLRGQLGGSLSVQLDFQTVMLASLQVGTGGRSWLWLQAKDDPLRWLALRRAAHARVAAGSPPPASAGKVQGTAP